MKKISTVFSNLAFICKMVYKTKKNYYILTLITILINALDPVINVYVIKGIVNAALNKVNIEKVMVYWHTSGISITLTLLPDAALWFSIEAEVPLLSAASSFSILIQPI